MILARKPRRPRLLGLCALFTAGGALLAWSAVEASPAERVLKALHPDFRQYVGAIRPIRDAGAATQQVYMALVRPGAADPTSRQSAPFKGSSARNDILYDPAVFDGSHSAGWVRLLLDHEYFHARHLAGATSIPLPSRAPASMEHHFLEAAAWGFNVAQAREGRYPGLTSREFREALDRYGEHYRAFRDLAGDETTSAWYAMGRTLREPGVLLTTRGLPRPEALLRPSGRGR